MTATLVSCNVLIPRSGRESSGSKAQQLADFFLMVLNFRIEVIDVFLNSRLNAWVVAHVRIVSDHLRHVALVARGDVRAVGIDWLHNDSAICIG